LVPASFQALARRAGRAVSIALSAAEAFRAITVTVTVREIVASEATDPKTPRSPHRDVCQAGTAQREGDREIPDDLRRFVQRPRASESSRGRRLFRSSGLRPVVAAC
jgi:hypothetical protein